MLPFCRDFVELLSLELYLELQMHFHSLS